MSFERRPAHEWQKAVPGARWFKADLHIHTVDDHAGGRARLPEGLAGEPTDPEVLSRYAKQFLKGLVASGVQVVGLTPHSPRAGSGPETSAVWHIVDEWNRGEDDDGVPFREKIYAVFPGFEPNVNDGANGVHLLFLFDPEIGRERYLALYDAIMDGRAPWEHSALRLTPRDAEEVFQTLDRRRSESERTNAPWTHIALAERGMDAARLKEIQELNRQAALLSSYEANLNATRARLETSEAAFDRLRGERRDLVEAQRSAFDRVMSEVEREFDGRIRARRIDHGVDCLWTPFYAH